MYIHTSTNKSMQRYMYEYIYICVVNVPGDLQKAAKQNRVRVELLG